MDTMNGVLTFDLDQDMDYYLTVRPTYSVQ